MSKTNHYSSLTGGPPTIPSDPLATNTDRISLLQERLRTLDASLSKVVVRTFDPGVSIRKFRSCCVPLGTRLHAEFARASGVSSDTAIIALHPDLTGDTMTHIAIREAAAAIFPMAVVSGANGSSLVYHVRAAAHLSHRWRQQIGTAGVTINHVTSLIDRRVATNIGRKAIEAVLADELDPVDRPLLSILRSRPPAELVQLLSTLPPAECTRG